MRLLRGLLDRVLLVAAILCAGAVPSFIAQYRQRLGGRLDQVRLDLAPFQRIADQFNGGSLDALVRYHLASRDDTFHAEGAAIQAMLTAAASLEAAVRALNADLAHQLLYLSRHVDAGVARATWGSFVPSVPLTAEGLIFAGAAGLVVWLAFTAVWQLGAWAFARATARRGAPA